MNKLIISRALGYNFGNFPGEAFEFCKNISNDSEGNIVIDTDCPNEILSKMRAAPVSEAPMVMTTAANGSLVVVPSPTVALTAAIAAGNAEFVPRRMNYGLADAQQAQVEPDVTVPICDRPLCTAAPAVLLDGNADDDADDAFDIFDITQEPQANSIVPIISPMFPQATHVPPDDVALVLAENMRNNLSSNASAINSKVLDLNRAMARIVVMKNEIGVLMNPILLNEKIAKILSQMQQLDAEDNLIESVKIVTRDYPQLAFFTKHIDTEQLSDTKRRSIGKMLILVSLKTLMAESARNLDLDGQAMIKIFNCDNKVVYNGGMFQCGHVNNDGDPCWGNMFNPILDCLVKNDIIMFAELVIKFIKNPDLSDSWGGAAKAFPETTAGRAI